MAGFMTDLVSKRIRIKQSLQERRNNMDVVPHIRGLLAKEDIELTQGQRDVLQNFVDNEKYRSLILSHSRENELLRSDFVVVQDLVEDQLSTFEKSELENFRIGYPAFRYRICTALFEDITKDVVDLYATLNLLSYEDHSAAYYEDSDL